MPTFVPIAAAWPFAPGRSPFGIKGTAYRGHLEFVAQHVPGGVDAMLAAIPDPQQRAFFATTFLASTYYDIFPLVLVAAPCGQLLNLSASEFVDQRSRDQAPKDLRGVYRFALAMVPTGSVARRLPRLLTQVCNFMSSRVEVDEPGHVQAVVTGIPAAIGPWLGTVLSAYGEAALLASGAATASFTTKLREVDEPLAEGVQAVEMDVDLRWV